MNKDSSSLYGGGPFSAMSARRFLGTAFQFQGSGSFVDQKHGWNGQTGIEDALIVTEGESLFHHALKIGKNVPSGITAPQPVFVFEETTTIPGTEEHIEVQENICAPTPPGAKKVFVIHGRFGSASAYLKRPEERGHYDCLEYDIRRAVQFTEQMSARLHLNAFLRSGGSRYSNLYDILGVGCALVFPGTPAQTITKRVLG